MKSRTWTNSRDAAGLYWGLGCADYHGAETRQLSDYGEKAGRMASRKTFQQSVVQLGVATEALNRHWYERTTGHVVKTSRAGSGIR